MISAGENLLFNSFSSSEILFQYFIRYLKDFSSLLFLIVCLYSISGVSLIFILPDKNVLHILQANNIFETESALLGLKV